MMAAEDHNSNSYPCPACPACGGSLGRVRRRWQDRLLSLLFPFKRYSCMAPSCNWEGLRYSRSEEARRKVKTPWRLVLALVVALAIYLLLRFR